MSVRRALALTGLALLLVLANPPAALGQANSREETQRRLEELRRQINEDRQRLSETAQAKQSSQETLNNLDRELALRQELVNTYRNRLRQLTREQDSLRQSIDRLSTQIASLKAEYRDRATHAYKYGRLHDVALVLAARSINQMLVRVRYLRRFTEERTERLESIQEKTAQARQQQQELAERQQATVELQAAAEEEVDNLSQLRKSRQRIVNELRTQEADLERMIADQQQTAQQLEAQLRRLVARETARQRRTNSTSAEASAEFERLSGSFEQNRGGLPWPSAGAVTEPFGIITNPVHGTKTPNPGIFIATSSQAEVRAIFEGQIVNIDAMPDLGTIVLIRHGEYLTLYGNFSMLYAGKNDRVSAGQVIGRAGTENEPRGAGLFFALFRDGQAVNPAEWLRSR